MKVGLHIVGLPHNQANKEHVSCAYGQKHKKFSEMMLSVGYKTYSYYGEHSDGKATEHIVISSDEDQSRWFGDYDFKNKFYPITWGVNDEHWVQSNTKAIEEIGKRIQPNDIICLIAGACQKQIADAFPDHTIVEYGIGYTGVFANFKVFESYAHMHWVYGNQRNDNGGFYDCVIPNYFDPQDFTIGLEKDDYYLFIGRLIQRKGVEIAVEATRRLGKKLIMAGQGVVQNTGNKVVAEDGMVYQGDHIEHIGSVGVEQRAELMSKAKAVFVPTTYLEPFGGVSIEAMMCGTPVIASDFGAFPENVVHGQSGYRFRTIGEATYYASQAELLSPEYIASYARKNFSTDVIKYKYDEYFKQLYDLRNGGGFYSDWHGGIDRYGKSY